MFRATYGIGLFTLWLIVLGFSGKLAADEDNHANHVQDVNPIIDKAVAAYGGEKLLQLQSLSFSGNFHHYSQWQSGHALQGEMMTYLTRLQVASAIDFKQQRKVFRQAAIRTIGSHGAEFPYVTHHLFDDGKGIVLDHALQQYQHQERINFDSAARGMEQWLDPIVIRQVNADRQHASFTDVAHIAGIPHDVITLYPKTDNEYIIYINQKSGLLSRVIRKQGATRRNFDYRQYQQASGIRWAKELLVSTASGPQYHTTDINISINSASEAQFAIPKNYQQKTPGKYIDVSQSSVRQLANDVYFVGQGWSYTLFIDLGDTLLSAGAWQMERDSGNWRKHLALLRSEYQMDKPVSLHLVTHHHSDHLMGLEDIQQQGSKLIIHPNDIPAVQAHLATPLEAERFITASDVHELLQGKIQLFDVPNSHANHNLILYIPEHKILFSEDMFGSSYETQLHSPINWPDGDTYFRLDLLHDKVQELGIDVNQYLSSHHARILQSSEIKQALQTPLPAADELLSRLFNTGK